MKDTYTGKVCNCYVAFHEPSNRIITMPVDAIKIPDYIYGKRLDDKQKQVLASGGQLPSMTYSARTTRFFPAWPLSIRESWISHSSRPENS